jgi:hypothetical protein
MLQVNKDLPFHAALRGSLEGIAPRHERAVLAGERFAKAARRRARLAWDVGCNDSRHAHVAAESADVVVAFDADHATVDALYRRLRDKGREDILPLVMSVTDPRPTSAGEGASALRWNVVERRSWCCASRSCTTSASPATFPCASSWTGFARWTRRS